MGCVAPAGVMEQEAGFLSAMESATAFGREGGELQLLGHAGQIVVRGSQGATTSKGDYRQVSRRVRVAILSRRLAGRTIALLPR